MRRRTGAIVQTKQGYVGVRFTLKDRAISAVQVYHGQSLAELRENFKDTPYGIALQDSLGYLFHLAFPFSGRRRIGMVIKGELDELLPFPVDDMVIDFRETAPGSVLVAAVPRTVASEANEDEGPRYVGLQSLSALYGLNWAGRLLPDDTVFVHFNDSAVVILGIKQGRPTLVRQFICGDDGGPFHQALGEVLQSPELHPRLCILVTETEEKAKWKDEIERIHNIKVEMPSLGESVGPSPIPSWLWSGFGAALLALSPKREINLAAKGRLALPGASKAAVWAMGGLAALSVLVWGLFYLNYGFKQAAWEYLDAQPAVIYKSVFPKSPQVKDVSRAFQERIRALERQSPGTNGLSALGLLRDLSSRIDPQIDVKINEFTMDEKEFTLSGTTVSFAALEKMKSAVEGLSGVTGLDLQNVELAANRQVRFKIRGKL